MDPQTRGRVEEWNRTELDGGLAAVRDLAADGFSGAVSAGETVAFLLNGRVIGVFDGRLEDLEDRPGTVHRAPDPGVALLLSMQERGGETQARYYSEETPIPSVDETLQEASFTGYLELSEGVLSGDYYLVYYGGRRMAAAYVGSAERLLTGQEAVERAVDEVGIYEVVSVDVDVTDLPDPEPEEAGTESAVASGVAAGDDADSGGRAVSEDATVGAEQDRAAGTAETDEPPAETTEPDRAARAEGDEPPAETTEPDRAARAEGEEPPVEDAETDPDAERFAEERQWRESRSIPSIEATATEEDRATDASTGEVTEDPDPEELHARIEALEETASSLRAERDRLTTETESLENTVAELEDELANRQGETAPGDRGSESIPPATALAETTVLVRYASKGDQTLETALEGQADRPSVRDNLRLELEPGFEAADVTVSGSGYREHVEGSMAYRFVEWLIAEAPFEIDETGATAGMAGLYEAVPRIDRIDLGGSISLDEAGEGSDEVDVDLVAYDKLGSPLVVATLTEGRSPADRTDVEALESAASAVCRAHEDLAAAVAVTESFFEPGALEAVDELTGSGFLRRSSKLSHVRVARGNGYHLCLVESMRDGFHLSVPDL